MSSSTANPTTGTSRTGAGTVPGTNTNTGPGTTTTTTTGGGGLGKSHGGQGKQVGSGIKEVFAKVHGVGEEIRGEFNSAVDEAFNEVGDIYPSLLTTLYYISPLLFFSFFFSNW